MVAFEVAAGEASSKGPEWGSKRGQNQGQEEGEEDWGLYSKVSSLSFSSDLGFGERTGLV